VWHDLCSPGTMETRRPRGRPIRRSARAARRIASALSDAGQRLAERLAYRPREVVVVALLAAGLLGGLGIERWRARHPVIADRLELERVRPAAAALIPAATRRRGRGAPARCEEPAAEAVTAARSGPRLDLNRATPGELAQVAGISWRLAARIVAAREVFEGREAPRGAADADRPAAGTESFDGDTVGSGATEPAPDVESP
jgi:hypothetical protein